MALGAKTRCVKHPGSSGLRFLVLALAVTVGAAAVAGPSIATFTSCRSPYR